MSDQYNEEINEQEIIYVESQYEEEEDNNKKKWMLILLLLFIMILLGGVFLWLNGKANIDPDEGSLERELAAQYGFLPDMTPEDIQAKLNEIIDESMLNISINPTPVFENGKAQGNIRIENTPNNHYGFVVVIKRLDTDETVMKTGLIEPGQFVEHRALDINLPKGSYDCIAHFLAYNIDSGVEIGQTGTPVTITVSK